MAATTLIIDLNDAGERQHLYAALKRLRGEHRIVICKHRKRRSDRANRFYHPCFVKPFAEFLREQGESYSNDDAHEMLKHKFLRGEYVDKKTGEVIAFTRSTTSLDTHEFNEYLDQCANWLWETFGIPKPEADVYHERDKP